MTKIKEWWGRFWWKYDGWIFTAGVLAVGTVIGLSLGVVCMPAPDQPKTSIAETNIAEPMVLYGLVDYSRVPPFNPATMEITRIDTVGWKGDEVIVGRDTTWVWADPAYTYSVNALRRHRAGSTFVAMITYNAKSTPVPVLDSEWIPKTSPLLTREENKKLKDLLGRSTVKEKK